MSLLFLNAAVIAHHDVLVAYGVHFIHFVFFDKLVKARKKFWNKEHNIFWIVHFLIEDIETHQIYHKESKIVMKFVYMSFFWLDNLYHLIRHKLAYQIISFCNLNIKDSLVIDAFALDHFSMVDSYCQQNCIHYLPNNKLKDLIFKTSG